MGTRDTAYSWPQPPQARSCLILETHTARFTESAFGAFVGVWGQIEQGSNGSSTT